MHFYSLLDGLKWLFMINDCPHTVQYIYLWYFISSWYQMNKYNFEYWMKIYALMFKKKLQIILHLKHYTCTYIK